MRPKKIPTTGGPGFIDKRLQEKLCRQGIEYLEFEYSGSKFIYNGLRQ